MVKNKKLMSNSRRYGPVTMRRRLDTGVWYYRYKDPVKNKWTGDKSIGTTNLDDAKLYIDHKVTPILKSIALGIPDDTLLLRELFEAYFEANAGLRSESLKKMKACRTNLKTWLEEDYDNILAKELTPDTLHQYKRYRESIGRAPRTVFNDLANLGAVYNWGMKNKMVAENPVTMLNERLSKHEKLTKNNTTRKKDVYTQKERENLIQEAENRKDFLIRDMIIAFSETGMRFEELAHMGKHWIKWREPYPFIEIRKRPEFTPKNPNDIKMVPVVSDRLKKILKQRSKTNGRFIFPNAVGNKIAENNSLKRLKRLFPKVGIDTKRKLHWHSFRNYFIKDCADKGLTFNQIKNIVGHEDEKMVMYYLNLHQHYDDIVKVADMIRGNQ